MKNTLLIIQLTLLLTSKLFAQNPPALADLPRESSISQGGITWTFTEAVPVGQFVNGDYYVVGPVTIRKIDPQPVIRQTDPQATRHGSILNPPARSEKMNYDGRIRGGKLVDLSILVQPPVHMKPGDLLMSSISAETRKGKGFMKLRKLNSATKSYSALTCLKAPVPPDTFRPGFSDPDRNLYFARNLQWERLKNLEKTATTPDINEWAGFFRQPWAGVQRLGASGAHDYQPQYSVETVRAEAIASLLLNLDFSKEEKTPLLVNFVQYGIDCYSLIRNGGCTDTWKAVGGHGNGVKWGITFAGILLGEQKMTHLNSNYPELQFGQDMQTAFVKDMPEGMQQCWNGSEVTYTGMYGVWQGKPAGKEPQHLPYEHQHPKDWVAATYTYWGTKTRTRFSGENYRRGQNSPAWVGAALAIRIMQAEEEYEHPAFVAYVDRWMTIDDVPLRAEIKAHMHPDDTTDLDNIPAGRAWDPFVEEMWEAHRGL